MTLIKANFLTGHISEEEIKEENAEKINGYPIYNICDHHTVDMRDIKKGTENWMNTVSVLLPDGQAVTFCVADLGGDINVDAKFYGTGATKVIGFSQGETDVIRDKSFYALVANKKG